MNTMHPVSLNPRLELAFSLYDNCELAADIGTDHAHLPAALLQRGRCQRMILTDISPSALNRARSVIFRCHLAERVDFRLGDGLSPLKESCGVISVTGMGGRTIRSILLSGHNRLCGASLILSAHTDWHLIRQTIQEIGYYPDREEPCLDGGRYYLLIRARPGSRSLSDREIRLGGPLFSSESPVLLPFLKRRRDILSVQLSGLLTAAHPNHGRIEQVRADLAYLDQKINGLLPGG